MHAPHHLTKLHKFHSQKHFQAQKYFINFLSAVFHDSENWTRVLSRLCVGTLPPSYAVALNSLIFSRLFIILVLETFPSVASNAPNTEIHWQTIFLQPHLWLLALTLDKLAVFLLIPPQYWGERAKNRFKPIFFFFLYLWWLICFLWGFWVYFKLQGTPVFSNLYAGAYF